MKIINTILIVFGLATALLGGMIGVEDGSSSLAVAGGVFCATGIALLFYFK